MYYGYVWNGGGEHDQNLKVGKYEMVGDGKYDKSGWVIT